MLHKFKKKILKLLESTRRSSWSTYFDEILEKLAENVEKI